VQTCDDCENKSEQERIGIRRQMNTRALLPLTAKPNLLEETLPNISQANEAPNGNIVPNDDLPMRLFPYDDINNTPTQALWSCQRLAILSGADFVDSGNSHQRLARRITTQGVARTTHREAGNVNGQSSYK
jgi:hypothetical protein